MILLCLTLHYCVADFSSALEEIRSLLPKCFLVSFDTEFTGLRGSDVRENWDDTPDERYCKLKKVRRGMELLYVYTVRLMRNRVLSARPHTRESRGESFSLRDSHSHTASKNTRMSTRPTLHTAYTAWTRYIPWRGLVRALICSLRC